MIINIIYINSDIECSSVNTIKQREYNRSTVINNWLVSTVTISAIIN